jgi:uncharacterized protein YciI
MVRAGVIVAAALALLVSTGRTLAQGGAEKAGASDAKGGFDEALAKSVGADDYGMKHYVLVILKPGPTKVPAGPERDEMFRGHMANIARLSAAGKLAVAGPFDDGPDGWRGLFVLAVADIEAAKQIVSSDPVIIKGEMIAEYHKWYASAALMLVPDSHKKLAKTSF